MNLKTQKTVSNWQRIVVTHGLIFKANMWLRRSISGAVMAFSVSQCIFRGREKLQQEAQGWRETVSVASSTSCLSSTSSSLWVFSFMSVSFCFIVNMQSRFYDYDIMLVIFGIFGFISVFFSIAKSILTRATLNKPESYMHWSWASVPWFSSYTPLNFLCSSKVFC